LLTVRLERRISRLSAEIMERLKDASMVALDLTALPIKYLARSVLSLGRVVAKSDIRRNGLWDRQARTAGRRLRASAPVTGAPLPFLHPPRQS
jgi:hypothetical protein